MQQFVVLLKKELFSYMQTSLLYGLFFIYLFASFYPTRLPSNRMADLWPM